ncbi:hypothetical protein SK128_007137 [Halocaridina rubra]|uniref:Molybdopterin adenylyltransferase n=1 Tax=Halocaridina rubra TaxID=373956 RepID=A0AAN9ACN4_HALRR
MSKWKKQYNYSRHYKKEWEKDFKWLTWIDNACYCKWCKCSLSNIRKSAFDQHEQSYKHKKAVGVIDSNEGPEEMSKCREQNSNYRQYKVDWEEQFKWLTWMDNACYCKWCKSFLSNMQKSSFELHEKTTKHRKAVSYKITGKVKENTENVTKGVKEFEEFISTVCNCSVLSVEKTRNMIQTGILTVSDRCSKGEAIDESGSNLKKIIVSGELFQGEVINYECVPDDKEVIKETLLDWCEKDLNLIITTGGTGFAPRDVTPEAVREIIEKEAPALSVQMITESLKVTPLAMLSRPVCGILVRTLIVTLPGSKKGSEECLRFIAPGIRHAVDLLVGRVSQVQKTHAELQTQGVAHHQGRSDSLHCHHKPLHDPHHQHHHETHHHIPEPEHGTSSADVSRICRRSRKSPYPMISVAEATNAVISAAWQCSTKRIKMDSALGYVLAEDIQAADPLPPFPASIKDGYAVVANDGAGLRKVSGSSTAGCKPELYSVVSGECTRINTGAPVPPGADAVVQVEDTNLLVEDDDGRVELEIEILKAPFVGQDIRPTGCDIAAGQTILTTGTLLGASEIGLLATVGVTEVLVVSKPTVAILSTGNELQDPNEPLRVGYIRDSNKTTLIALLKQHDFPVIDAGIAKDDPTSLLKSLKSALAQADVLVTTGGVSMGDRDLLRPVLVSDFQAEIHFAQVFMKPGKPTTFATCIYSGQKKLILGLPGNPVSAVVTSNLYLLPLCRKMSGRANYMYTCIRAKLSAPVRLDPRPEYHRATLCWKEGEDLPVVYSTGNQLSSRLLSMASAQVLLRLPPRTEDQESLPENTIVEALLLQF